MPRTARAAAGGLVYHILNPGNNREAIFLKAGDYAAFLKLLAEGKQRASVEVFAYCLMPNHWHLVLRPQGDQDLALFMGWVTNTHVKRYRKHYPDRGVGHLYQGRYKSFPVQDDLHLLAVMRYVEANPLRAGLVQRAEQWPWSSMGARSGGSGNDLLSPWPVKRPENWMDLVNESVPERELAVLRECANRGRPYGAPAWVQAAVKALGLEFTLHRRGRPKKELAAT